VYADPAAIQSPRPICEDEGMSTEAVSPRYLDLDLWENSEALKALYEAQLAAVAAVGPALDDIAAAVDAAAANLRRGGRLIYVGAGTSGRIAAQDGAELAPTFNWPADKLVVVMAGGESAFLRSAEGAEDSATAATQRIDDIQAGPDDVVIALAASGATPFTIGAVEAARRRGALTIGVANNPNAPLLHASAHPILVATGAEPIAGSTRLKAGTAQKVVLNLFSTLLMIRLGRVYRGFMVHMRPSNEKLRRRAADMVAAITGCSQEAAAAALKSADGDVKRAVLLACGLRGSDAEALLQKHDGNLRLALAEHAAHVRD
jgi:N-acetylmuramic acid 6-phosphate etherase